MHSGHPLDPSNYSTQASAFITFLSENAQANKDARIKKFFELMGINIQAQHTALEIQHVIGLALRELLAQTMPSNEARLRHVKAGDMPFEFLEDSDFMVLQETFATNVAIIPDQDFYIRSIKNSMQHSFASINNSNVAQPKEMLNTALDENVELLLQNSKFNPNGTILNVPDHFSVADSHVIGNGNCACAAFAMKLAEQVGIQIEAVTDAQLIAYKETSDYMLKAEGTVLKTNHIENSSPLKQACSIFNAARDAIKASNVGADQKQELIVIVDQKQDALFGGALGLPEYSEVIAPVLTLELLIKADNKANLRVAEKAQNASTIAEDLAKVNNNYQAFIAEQDKLLKYFKRNSAKASPRNNGRVSTTFKAVAEERAQNTVTPQADAGNNQ